MIQNNNEQAIEEARKVLSTKKKPVKPGISNAAQRCKDELKKDPYSLKWISDLGCVYAKEEMWDLCQNVMLRGWKRANTELDRDAAFVFLMKLCDASFLCKQYRQAHAVFNDIEVPEIGTIEFRAYSILGCNVYSANNDMQKALKSFNNAIEGVGFDVTMAAWSVCHMGMRKVGAYEAAKNTVDGRCGNDAELMKVDKIELIAETEAQLSAPLNEHPMWLPNLIIGVSVAVCLLIITAFFWYIEHRSLQGLGLKAVGK